MKYILAVSGGIDSVVLLDMTMRQEAFRQLHFGGALWPEDFIVAHFNHGIRPESGADRAFVAQLCAEYDVTFTSKSVNLGPGASEATAREQRYQFLYLVARQSGDAVIVTAHHQDDLIETVTMNVLRGTGWRGLAPMNSRIKRPLLDMTKADITSYAIDHDLDWSEDVTNFSSHYFRNRIRDRLVTMTPDNRHKLIELYYRQRQLRKVIESDIEQLFHSVATSESHNIIIPRYWLIMASETVALELLHRATERRLTRPQLGRVLWFAKAAKNGKQLLFHAVNIQATRRSLIIT